MNRPGPQLRLFLCPPVTAYNPGMTVLPVPDLLARALDRRAGLPGAGTTFFRAVHITETGACGRWTWPVTPEY